MQAFPWNDPDAQRLRLALGRHIEGWEKRSEPGWRWQSPVRIILLLLALALGLYAAAIALGERDTLGLRELLPNWLLLAAFLALVAAVVVAFGSALLAVVSLALNLLSGIWSWVTAAHGVHRIVRGAVVLVTAGVAVYFIWTIQRS